MAETRMHVSLNVSDLDASVRFYERLFGTPAAKRKSDYAKFTPTLPALNLALNLVPTALNSSSPLSHLGIQVADTAAVESHKRRLEAAGVTIDSEETDEVCCYALQDKIWVKDPDGNAWEVFTVHADAEAKMSKDTTCCVPSDAAEESSCC